MQNYRDPPPYPGHSKQVYTNQPGFRQSFSGSETSTDVSLSSTENLATSQRQEPQGEETQASLYSHLDPSDGYSILARLGMSQGLDPPTPNFDPSTPTFSSAAHNNPGSSTTTMSFTTPKLFGADRSHQNQSTPFGIDRSHQSQSQQHLYSSSSSKGLGQKKLGPQLSTYNAMSTPHMQQFTTPSPASPLTAQGHLTVPQWQAKPRGNNIPIIRRQSNEIGSGLLSSSLSKSSNSLKEYSSTSSSVTHLNSSRTEFSQLTTSTSKSGASSTGALAGTQDGLGSSSLNSSSSSSTSSCQQYLSPRVPPVSTYHHSHPYVNTNWVAPDSSDMLGHSQNTQNTQNTGFGSLKPPPQYPGRPMVWPTSKDSKSTNIRTCRSHEAVDKVDRCEDSRSHPDLRFGAPQSPGIYANHPKMSASPNTSGDDSDAGVAQKASQMVEMLTEENRQLRAELEQTQVKVSRLQKLEQEIQKVHDSHAGLIKSSEKRETLWVAMQRKMQERIRDLEAARGAAAGPASGNPAQSDAALCMKIAENDALISKLLSQNQKLSFSRDQLEGENVQLTLSLSEKRAHVDIYENALLNAQSKVLTLEEEMGKKQQCVDKVEHLQSALQSLQASGDKQERKAQEMRQSLEREIQRYKQDKPMARQEDKSVGMLRKMLDEKDARILALETKMAAMEQKYVKEATLRHLSMEETTHAPQEVRLAALEKSSSDIGRLIDEAKAEKLKHMEALHTSEKHVAELEAQVRQLQTQLVEKEAMVKVFQRSPLGHAPLGRSSSLHALCHASLHSPRPSLIASLGARDGPAIRHMKTGSTSAIELGRKMSIDEDFLTKVQNLNTETKSDSDEEVKLWHV